MDPMEERALLEAVQAGRTEHFGVIIKEYQRRAYLVALPLVQDTHEALDLAQEAFLRAFRKIHTFDVEQPFFPWFYRILKNLCFSHLKRRRRSWSLTEKGEDGEVREREIPDVEFNPAILAERSDTTERFHIAFQQVPEKDREILYLRHFQDLAYAEIAQVLEIPIGTVMSRLFYARRKLKKLLEKDLS
jgi:RNA polymerase sigma-70 factor (ECF subfamily)